jgi:hypothetical protein
MMAKVSQKCNLGIHYLSPMHIADGVIGGYDLPDDHPDMIDLMARQRDEVNKKRRNESKLAISKYILRAMKQVKEHGCLLAAHHIG